MLPLLLVLLVTVAQLSLGQDVSFGDETTVQPQVSLLTFLIIMYTLSVLITSKTNSMIFREGGGMSKSFY